MTTATHQKRKEDSFAKYMAKPKNKAYANLGLAFIEKPLKFIASRLNSRDDKGNPILHSSYVLAYDYASRGDGTVAKRIAFSLV
jgi:hypothetical protein